MHLLCRTGFGVLPHEIEEFHSLNRFDAADRLLGFRRSRYRPGGGKSLANVQDRYFKLLVKRNTPGLREKLVLFWHNYFATSDDGVGDPRLMSAQNRLFRFHCRGNFKQLLKEVGRDAAMLEYLDVAQSGREAPNENYARELLELFSLGTHDFAGQENYTQEDIVQIARAFSGWRYRPGRTPGYFDPVQHDFSGDFPERGPKAIFLNRSGFGSAGRAFDDLGEGEAEAGRVVDILLEHVDSDGRNTTARRVTRRLLEFFVHGGYADPVRAKPVVDEVIETSGFDQSFELTPLLRAILTHDAFYEAVEGNAAGLPVERTIKWPIDFIVSTLRMLQIPPRKNRLYGGGHLTLRDHASRMGQRMMEPPSVFGWKLEDGWITSGRMLSRCAFGRDVAMTRSGGKKTRLNPLKLLASDLSDPTDVVNAAAEILGMAGRYSSKETAAFVDYLTADGLTQIDMLDEEFVDRKIRGLFALLIQSPAYQAH